MRIAILGSVALPVPPPKQGGTEWMAYYQAVGLASKGHQVLLFGAKGTSEQVTKNLEQGTRNLESGNADKVQSSKFKVLDHLKIIEVGGGDVFSKYKDLSGIESSRKLRLENIYLGQVIEELLSHREGYDLILNNMRGEAVFLPVAKYLNKPMVNVLHLPVFEELAEVLKQYNIPLISISNVQQRLWPELNYLGTVYNGVDPSLFPFSGTKGDYLLMMATFGKHKNQKEAILAARETGEKLVLAGRVRDADYYEECRPLIDGDQIKHIGEMDFEEKVKLYRGAKAFLFPILWEEPFGLVMIEAMSCGVPVIAYSHGAVPEVVEDGKSGLIVQSVECKVQSNSPKLRINKIGVEGLVEGIKRIGEIERGDCRKRVEEKFTVEKMVEGYEKALLGIKSK